MDKRNIGRYSETRRIFGAVGKMYDPTLFGEFVKIGLANVDGVLKRGSRVVLQCGDWRIEVHAGMLEEGAEGLGRKLRKEAEVFVPKSTESNAKGNEKEEGARARRNEKCASARRNEKEGGARERLLQAKRNLGERKLRDLQKEVNRLDRKIRDKKGEPETMKNRTPPTRFLPGTMEWLNNEVRHWSRILDLLKQEEEKMAEGEEAVKDKWKEGEGVEEAKVSAVNEEEVAESCEASEPDEESKKGSDGRMGSLPDKMKAEGNDEEISDGEMESLPDKVKDLEESLATETAKTERILREANKQSALQFDELCRSDCERACQQAVLLASRRQEARAKEAAEREKAAAEGLRWELEKLKAERATAEPKVEGVEDQEKTEPPKGQETRRGADTKTLPCTVEATSPHDRQGSDLNLAKIQGCRRKFIKYMKTVGYPENFDAEMAKVCSNGQIFPRNGRFSIADAQEFLDVWAAQGRVGQRGAGDDRGKRDCVLGKASEELDVDTMHDCQDDVCSFMMNEWRAIWLLRDGHQHVWTDGCERADPYKLGPYKGGRERLKLIKSLGYKVSFPKRK